LIAAKLTTAQETLERDRQELPILQKRVSQPFDQLQTYHEKANRLEFLKQLFDMIANEAPVWLPIFDWLRLTNLNNHSINFSPN
jgi:hypothetical protein